MHFQIEQPAYIYKVLKLESYIELVAPLRLWLTIPLNSQKTQALPYHVLQQTKSVLVILSECARYKASRKTVKGLLNSP